MGDAVIVLAWHLKHTLASLQSIVVISSLEDTLFPQGVGNDSDAYAQLEV